MLRTVAAGHRDDRSFARFDLLDVVQVFGKHGIIRRDENRGQIRPNQRDHAVLEFCARMAFGKKIGDFFHLQRAFESDREIELAPEKQHPVRLDIFLRDLFDLIAQLRALLRFVRAALRVLRSARSLPRSRDAASGLRSNPMKRQDRRPAT